MPETMELTEQRNGNISDKIAYLAPKLTIKNVPKEEPSTENEYIKLKSNEVIQFRAPNYRTTITYPAYTNYYAKLSTGLVEEAKAAEFITIFEYLKKYATEYTQIFNLYTVEAKELDIIEYTPPATAPTDKTPEETKFDSWLLEYPHAFVAYKDSTGKYSKYSACDKWPWADGSEKRSGKVAIFKLNKQNYGKWFTYFDKKGLSGIYATIGQDQSWQIGKLIDANKNKFKLNTVSVELIEPTKNLYVPLSKDSLGQDAVYAYITPNSDYTLKSGEYLCINYTNAETVADEESIKETGIGGVTSTASEVINEFYGPGDTIRPNFELKNSDDVRKGGKSYSKTQGFDFRKYTSETIPGMYSIGASEQIEIRKNVNIKVYDDTENSKVFVYFILNNETINKNDNNIIFLKPNEEKVLSEGEYFWYTDKNKTTLTRCGNGTKIINKTGGIIQKTYNENWVDAIKIENSNMKDVSWITISGLRLHDEEGNVRPDAKYIEWLEYQYITLVEGDSLICCNVDNTSGQISTDEWLKVTNSAATPTKYILNDKKSILPIIDTGNSTDKWEVKAKLTLNTSGSMAQTLINDNQRKEELVLKNENGDTIVQISAPDPSPEKQEQNTISIKTNYSVNSSLDEIDVSIEDKNNKNLDKLDEFKVKVFKNNDIQIKENSDQPESIYLNNMGTYYTSFTFTDSKHGEIFSTIHCMKENADQYGIIMFYYISSETSVDNNVSISYSKSNNFPVIFNYYNSASHEDENMTWWDGRYKKSRCYLKPNALNVVKITENDDINIYAGSSQDDILIMSPLRLVKVTGDNRGLDLDLLQYKYSKALTGNPAHQLLEDILKLDPEYKFFYNTVIDRTTELDINPYAEENLATPRIQYSYNNINNKFVISEIDTSYIDKGITFASSSIKVE